MRHCNDNLGGTCSGSRHEWQNCNTDDCRSEWQVVMVAGRELRPLHGYDDFVSIRLHGRYKWQVTDWINLDGKDDDFEAGDINRFRFKAYIGDVLQTAETRTHCNPRAEDNSCRSGDYLDCVAYKVMAGYVGISQTYTCPRMYVPGYWEPKSGKYIGFKPKVDWW